MVMLSPAITMPMARSTIPDIRGVLTSDKFPHLSVQCVHIDPHSAVPPGAAEWKHSELGVRLGGQGTRDSRPGPGWSKTNASGI